MYELIANRGCRVKFYLIHPKNETSSIFADVNYKSFRLRLTTGIIIAPAAWNAEKQKVSSRDLAYVQINNQLANIRAQVDKYISEIKINRIAVDDETFTKNIQFRVNPNAFSSVEVCPDPAGQPDMLAEYQKFIDLRRASGNYKEKTIGNYQHSLKTLRLYQEYSGTELGFGSMNKAFFESFITYLRQERQMVNNTIGTIVRTLKTFLNYAVDTKLTDNHEFQKRGSFKAFNESVEVIALSKDDVQKIK